MKVLYCNSFQSFYLALSWKQMGEAVELWSLKPSILKAAERLGIPTRELPGHKNAWWISKPGVMRRQLHQVASWLHEGDELHFSHTQWDRFLFKLIPVLRRFQPTIPIHLWDFEYTYDWLAPGFNHLTTRMEHWISEIFFPSKSGLKVFKGTVVPGIDEAYRKHWKITYHDFKNEYWQLVAETCALVDLGLGPVDWLFLEQPDLLVTGDQEEVLIQKVLSLNCKVKRHPAAKREIWNDRIYGDDYPFELTLSGVSAGVLGVNSAGLIFAARQGLTTISLLQIIVRMLPAGEREQLEVLQQDLIERSNGRIQFPQDWKEVEKQMSH